MSRKPVPAWTEQVPCATCKRPRTVTANHRWYFEKAATKSCRTCNGRRTATNINTARRGRVNGPTVPAARRFVPDEDVVDWVVVDRLMSGKIPPGWWNSTHAERVAAAAALTALGLSAGEIAERMNVTQRAVVRLRAVVRQEVGAA